MGFITIKSRVGRMFLEPFPSIKLMQIEVCGSLFLNMWVGEIFFQLPVERMTPEFFLLKRYCMSHRPLNIESCIILMKL